MRVGLIQSTENKNKGPSGGETKEDAMGLLDNEAFCVPHFLLVGNRLQPLRPSLSSKGQIQTC